MSQPDLDAFYDQLCSRYAWDFGALSAGAGIASGLVHGTNPPYSANDLFAMHPKFGGAPVTLTATLAAGSTVVAVESTAGLSAGQLIAGAGVSPGTLISSVDSASQITLSAAATVTGTAALAVYAAPLVPLAVINAYIALASASLVQARWLDTWPVAMGLYVSHFLTLWMKSDGDVYSTPGQAAAAGLARGIAVSNSAGSVSVGYQVTPGLEAWGSWNETQYGKQLATFAKCVGAGPIWIY